MKRNLIIVLLNWFYFALLLSKWIGPFASFLPYTPTLNCSFGIQPQMTISLLLSPYLSHLSPALSTVLSSVSVSLSHTFLFFVSVSALRPLCQYAVSLSFWHFSFFFVITGFTVWRKEKNSESGSKSHLVSTLLFFLPLHLKSIP